MKRLVPELAMVPMFSTSHQLVTGHADTVVRDANGTGLLVEAHMDVQLAVTFIQVVFAEGFEAQLVAGIGGIGDKFAKEDFLVGIQGMDHQL